MSWPLTCNLTIACCIVVCCCTLSFLGRLQDAKSDDNELATDNALSALAALLEHHADVLDAAQVCTWEWAGGVV
jgi:hypothetical protein